MKKIFLASDHAGFEYKEKLIQSLKDLNYECIDCGTNSNESVDYPIYAKKLCENVLSNEDSCGILICGTGIGMSIAANRFKKIRATVCWNEETVKLAREHNNSNVLCLGARMLSFEEVLSFAKLFLTTDFTYGKHLRRINEIDEF